MPDKSLNDIVFFRLKWVVKAISPDRRANPRRDSKLGDFFDNTTIKGEFVVRLNSGRLGFDDLARPITRNQVNDQTKISGLVTAIMNKRHVRGGTKMPLSAYKTAMRARVDRCLKRNISLLSNVPPDRINLDADIRTYLSDDPSIHLLYRGISYDLAKFILLPLHPEHFEGTVGDVRYKIFIRCT